MTIFLTEALKKPKDLGLGYVNYENDCLETTINCSSPLSCRYLGKLKANEFIMVKFNTAEEGKEAVKRNKVWGMVKFNSNFSEGVVNRLDYFYASEHVEISDEDQATVWLDMSSYIIGHLLQKHMYESYLESLEEWYADCGWNVKSVHPIIRIEEPIYGQVDESLITSCIPGTTTIMVFSVGVELGLILVLIEKELGTLERCRVSGLKTSELLVSQFLFCFCSMIPMEIAQLAILYLYSGPSNGPLLWTVILLLLQAVVGILLGLLIGLLAQNLSHALQISVGLMAALYYGSGLIWPIEGGHWLTKIAYIILPPTLSTGSMMMMANRGSGPKDPAVYFGLISSIIWIVIFLALIALYLRQRSKKK